MGWARASGLPVLLPRGMASDGRLVAADRPRPMMMGVGRLGVGSVLLRPAFAALDGVGCSRPYWQTRSRPRAAAAGNRRPQREWAGPAAGCWQCLLRPELLPPSDKDL